MVEGWGLAPSMAQCEPAVGPNLAGGKRTGIMDRLSSTVRVALCLFGHADTALPITTRSFAESGVIGVAGVPCPLRSAGCPRPSRSRTPLVRPRPQTVLTHLHHNLVLTLDRAQLDPAARSAGATPTHPPPTHSPQPTHPHHTTHTHHSLLLTALALPGENPDHHHIAKRDGGRDFRRGVQGKGR